jgi:CTD small phosphatase-like protein 2
VLILDMDETLIHCVDDIEAQNPDVILEIDFPGEETVCAGINIRPYLIECLQDANSKMQVIVFTASHQTYADAILDYLDPENTLF